MINEVIYKFTSSLVDTDTHIRCITVQNSDCTTGDPIYIDGECWTPCGDEVEYCNPVIDGDTLYFQTRFPDNISADPTDPDSGWDTSIYVRGFVYDVDHTLIGNVLSHSTNYMAGYYKGSYQNIIIDVDTISNTCFYFAFSYKTDASTWSDPIYTEPFCKVLCDQQTVLIQGDILGYDCFNMFHGTTFATIKTLPIVPGVHPYYGTSYFDFIPKLRIYGEMLHEGSEIVKTEDFDNNVTKSVTNDLYTVRSGLVPPYVAKKMTGQILAGQRVYVDGVEYELRTPPQRNNEDNRMWLMDIELAKECEIDFLCS